MDIALRHSFGAALRLSSWKNFQKLNPRLIRLIPHQAYVQVQSMDTRLKVAGYVPCVGPCGMLFL